jgi:hypothetical protein
MGEGMMEQVKRFQVPVMWTREAKPVMNILADDCVLAQDYDLLVAEYDTRTMECIVAKAELHRAEGLHKELLQKLERLCCAGREFTPTHKHKETGEQFSTGEINSDMLVRDKNGEHRLFDKSFLTPIQPVEE